MIPSLIDQVVAARIPTRGEVVSAQRQQDRLESIHGAVRKIGNTTVQTLSKATGLSASTCRDALKALESAGRLYSWQPHKHSGRMWAVVK